MKKKLRSLKGFTLLELIIVIAIISVLLMIIVPNMTDYMRSNRMRAANDKAQQLYMATQDYLNTLQTRGAKVEDYFGPTYGNICRLGVEHSAAKGHTCSGGGDGKDICENDIKLIVVDSTTTTTFTGTALVAENSKTVEAARSIKKNLSGDFEGAWYVEVYPKTYTVKVALYTEQPSDCTDSICVNSKTVYDWDAIFQIAMHHYKSTFADGPEGLSNGAIHGRDMAFSDSQETSYNKGARTAYVGQYPIP